MEHGRQAEAEVLLRPAARQVVPHQRALERDIRREPCRVLLYVSACHFHGWISVSGHQAFDARATQGIARAVAAVREKSRKRFICNEIEIGTIRTMCHPWDIEATGWDTESLHLQ